MGQTIITAGTVILALIVGVLIEPAKNAFSHRARLRQIRAERCEELMRVAIAHHEARAKLQTRFIESFGSIYPVTVDSVGVEFDKLDELLGKAVALAGVIHLYGPKELGDAALKFASGADMDELPSPVNGMSEDEIIRIMGERTIQFRLAMEKFVIVARKHISR